MSANDFADIFVSGDENLFWLRLWFIESVVIIVINTITIIIFSTNRRDFGRAVYVLINLAVSDLMYGVSMGSIFVHAHADQLPSVNQVKRFWLIRGILITFVLGSSMASALSIFIVAIDRFAAIFLPFRYRVTEPKLYVFAIAMCWCCSIGTSVAQFFIPKKYIYILIFFYASCISIGLLGIIMLYTAIFLKMRRQSICNNRTAQVAQQREKNMAYTSMTVTFCSILTWLPIATVFAVSLSTSKKTPLEISCISIMFQALNSFINPIIYAFRMRVFRKELVRLLCRCVHRIHPNDANANN